MLNYEFPPIGGGAGNANYYLLKEFAKNKDLRIDLITCSEDRYKEEQFSGNIKIFKIYVRKSNSHYWTSKEMLRWTLKAYKLAKELTKKNKYDLCHCWFGWPCGWIGSRLKMPYIVALRGSDVPGYNIRLKFLDKIFFKPLSKKIWKKAMVVTTNSEGLKELALKTLNRDIKIIYNGVNINEFRPNCIRKIGDKIKLVSTGRLIKRKGYEYLIEALKSFKDDYTLTLVGDGDLEGELKELSKGLNVEFRGKLNREGVIKELQKADIFVLPSLNEGMSNSVLEAMACGLPVIVTDVGGSKELIKDNGIIVEKGSVESLKNVLNKIDIKDLDEMGKKSRRIAEEMSWGKVAESYGGIYNAK